MDRFLEKEEKNLLLKLLEVNKNAFWNVPLMKGAFRKASKKWHPDKGGNLQTMMLLNSLWQKYQEGVVELRNTEVCAAWLPDFWDITLLGFYGTKLKELIYKTPQCLTKGPTTCNCLCCLLRTQHKVLKLQLKQRCLFWGKCYCYHCFYVWFGLPQNWQTFDLWAQVLSHMPRALLQLESHALSKYFSPFPHKIFRLDA